MPRYGGQEFYFFHGDLFEIKRDGHEDRPRLSAVFTSRSLRISYWTAGTLLVDVNPRQSD